MNTELKQKIESLLTRDQFVSWLRTRPSDEPFTYVDNCHCALGKFLQSHDIPVGADGVLVGGDDVGPVDGDQVPIPKDIFDPFKHFNRAPVTQTMGNLLKFFV